MIIFSIILSLQRICVYFQHVSISSIKIMYFIDAWYEGIISKRNEHDTLSYLVIAILKVQF